MLHDDSFLLVPLSREAAHVTVTRKALSFLRVCILSKRDTKNDSKALCVSVSNRETNVAGTQGFIISLCILSKTQRMIRKPCVCQRQIETNACR